MPKLGPDRLVLVHQAQISWSATELLTQALGVLSLTASFTCNRISYLSVFSCPWILRPGNFTDKSEFDLGQYCLKQPCLTLFGPAYFGASGIQGGGHIVPPLNIWLGRVRVPILVGNDEICSNSIDSVTNSLNVNLEQPQIYESKTLSQITKMNSTRTEPLKNL